MTGAYMARALELAGVALGTTSPNPAVGAVLVNDGRIVGEGHTQAAGGPHAERQALAHAGDLARGATLYVTLEPCAHTGRTGPCADALIEARIAAAHVAVLDPNPRVNGQGIESLRAHGIEVVLGEEAEAAEELIDFHTRYITTGLPLVTVALELPDAVLEPLERTSDAIVLDWDRQEQATLTPRVLITGTGERMPLDANENLPALLRDLGRNAVTSCLVSGTPALCDLFLSAGLVDKIAAGSSAAIPPGFVVHRKHPIYQILYRNDWRL